MVSAMPALTQEGSVSLPAKRRVVMFNTNNRPAGVPSSSHADDEPPLIPRYDTPSLPAGGGSRVTPVRKTMEQPHNKMHNAGKVIVIRRPDGSTQLLRPVALQEDDRGGRGGGGGGRVVRVPARMDPFARRFPVEGPRMLPHLNAGMHVRRGFGGGMYADDIPFDYPMRASARPQMRMQPQLQFGRSGAPFIRPVYPRSMNMPFLEDRYGLGMRRMGMREIFDRKGFDHRWTGNRPSRRIQFDFEQNEDEERAISDAIAREEEMMRLEDEMKRALDPRHESEFSSSLWNHEPSVKHFTSHLTVNPGDSADTKIIKHMLDTMIMQVCKWDKVHGWSKQWVTPRVRRRIDADPAVALRRMQNKAHEMAVTERMEMMRREVNKQRAMLEANAEEELGVSAPWKKSRGRPNKSFLRNLSPQNRRAVDPREISLGASPRRLSTSQHSSPVKEGKEEWSEKDCIADRVRRKRNSESHSLHSVKVERREKGEGVNCVCRRPFNPAKTYVQCCRCSVWMHAKCMGIEDKKVKMMKDWVCPDCSSPQSPEGSAEGEDGHQLYCICRTPYDDSKFYVGCDFCEDWFHPECVGTTQDEAEGMDEYMCPLCAEKKDVKPSSSHVNDVSLTRSDYPLLYECIDMMIVEECAEPFLAPVDIRHHPDYHEHISQPMDLGEMRRKVDDLEYETLREMHADFHLIVSNARQYNSEKSALRKAADRLEKIVQERMSQVYLHIEKRRATLRKQSECGTVDSCLDIDTDQLIEPCVDPDMFGQLL